MWQRTMRPEGRCLAGSRVKKVDSDGYDCNLFKAIPLFESFIIWTNRFKTK